MSASGWILLFAAAYFARLWPRLLRPGALAADTFYHLVAADGIRRAGLRLPRHLPGLCFPGPYDYPPLYHWLLALLPRAARDRFERHAGAVFDSLLLAMVSAWAVRALPDRPSAAVAAVLFAFSPTLLSVGTGPRAYQATPRIAGEILFTAALLGCGLWVVEGTVWGFALGVIAGAVGLLTSKFGAQCLWFMLPLIAAQTGKWELAAVPPASALLAIVISRGHYLSILKAHFGHLYLYHRIGPERMHKVFSKSSWSKLPDFFRDLLVAPRRAAKAVLWENCILAMASRNLHLLALPPALWAAGALSGWERWWLACVVASLLVFGATSLRALLLLGEPERYVEFSVSAQILLLVSLWSRLPHGDRVLGGIAVWSVLSSAAFGAVFVRIYTSAGPSTLRDEMLTFLRRQPRRLRILHFFEAPHSLAYRSGHDVFYPCGNFQIWVTSPEEYRRIYEDQAVPNRAELATTVSRYHLDTMLVNKASMLQRGYDFTAPDFARKVFENDKYVIYDVDRAALSRACAPREVEAV